MDIFSHYSLCLLFITALVQVVLTHLWAICLLAAFLLSCCLFCLWIGGTLPHILSTPYFLVCIFCIYHAGLRITLPLLASPLRGTPSHRVLARCRSCSLGAALSPLAHLFARAAPYALFSPLSAVLLTPRYPSSRRYCGDTPAYLLAPHRKHYASFLVLPRIHALPPAFPFSRFSLFPLSTSFIAVRSRRGRWGIPPHAYLPRVSWSPVNSVPVAATWARRSPLWVSYGGHSPSPSMQCPVVFLPSPLCLLHSYCPPPCA